jgi:dodecin
VADLSAQWFASLMDHVHRVTEIVGSSSNSVDEAIRHGVSRATRTLRNVDWFEVAEIRWAVQDDQLRGVRAAWFGGRGPRAVAYCRV